MAACHCEGRSGNRKRLFRSWDQAWQVGMRDFDDDFDIYPCPTKKHRFHLSHTLEYRRR